MSLASDTSRDDGAAPGRRIERPLAFVSALAGIGAIAVSSCCALPLALAVAGIGTGWLGDLEAFSGYRPAILSLAGIALAAAWTASFRRTSALVCTADGACAAAPRRPLTVGMLIVATAIFGLGAVWRSIENDVLGVLIRLQ